MLIALNKLQTRSFQRFLKKVEFDLFSVEPSIDKGVIIRFTDSQAWELMIDIDRWGKVTSWKKINKNEDQPIQS